MRKRVVLLHTSLVFFEREPLLFDLLKQHLPDVEIANIVDDSILKEVIDQQGISRGHIRRMCFYAMAAENMAARVIFNTCSSLGPTMDVARQLVSIPIVKIDDGMAEEAARVSGPIAVLATVPSTIGPTIDLIRQHAGKAGSMVEPTGILCEGAFEILIQGDPERHDELVSQKAKEASQWAKTLVLAQCSMARLAPRLSDETGLRVLSSPLSGVMELKRVLEQTSVQVHSTIGGA
jgi:Asp/Glu/hydantoin racemase